MDKIDITKLNVTELKAMFYDRQMELGAIQKELQLLGAEIRKRESKDMKVLKQDKK